MIHIFLFLKAEIEEKKCIASQYLKIYFKKKSSWEKFVEIFLEKNWCKKCDEFVTNNKTTLTTSGFWGTRDHPRFFDQVGNQTTR